MGQAKPDHVSHLIVAWRSGDQHALEQLLPLVYSELRALASRHMRAERADHTLQTTALVHEAYLRLVGADVKWDGRAHFFAVAAQAMRRILVDHARTRARAKRGGGAVFTLDDEIAAAPERPPEILALDEALERLSSLDERKARTVELHFFGGLTQEETASVLGISRATVDRELRLAKAWLYKELSSER